MYSSKSTVAVLVATAHRTDLLKARALPSIKNQYRTPSRVIVVDDSGDDDAERSEQLVRNWQPAGINVDFLRNRRTKGAAGAWNSGLDHLLRTCNDPTQLYVAILDDDDRWDPRHLKRCLEAAKNHGLDMVAAPFQRIEENAEAQLIVPPRSLEVASFLVGNPGIQGSNLVCRLSVLLEAGLFDESLPSCTDRDLCIRIAELPGVRYGITTEPTVHHFASQSRPRLSTPGSPAKTGGLIRFFRKYRGRMSNAQRTEFWTRAERLFGINESAFELTINMPARRVASSRIEGAAPRQSPPHLIVGMIVDTAQPEAIRHLLVDLRGLAEDPGLSGLDVLILENGCDQTSCEDLRNLVENERNLGLRIHLVDREQHIEDSRSGLVLDRGASHGRKLFIADARTVLQTYLYAFGKNRPGSIVWIVDDDMRLDPLVIDENGELQRRAQELVPLLRELRRLRASRVVDIVFGAYTGAPPLPFAATVRVQLVDLVASLHWLATQDSQAVLPDRGLENATLRVGQCDYYYDLSRKKTDQLEMPFWITPAFPKETVAEAFTRIASAAERILAGEQVFRPLAIENGINPLESISDDLQRGGNTFVFDVEALRLAPNSSPTIDERPSRRSDMIWALLQKHYFNRHIVTVPIALYHDRSHLPVGELDIERIVDDIRGYGMFSALQDFPGIFTKTDDLSLVLSEEMTEDFVACVGKYVEERLSAFRLSFHRIRGLTRILRCLADKKEVWWREDKKYRAAIKQLRTFSDHLTDCYEVDKLNRIEREARALNIRQICKFLRQLPIEIKQHRKRLSNYETLASRGLEGERRANAKAIAARLAAPAGSLKVLGSGKEGVALSDGKHVFKVFDYWWKSSPEVTAPAFLRTLVGAYNDTHCLYPILSFHESGHRAVLIYPFEESEPYAGGYGPGMVTLLAECWRHGIFHRNIDPNNLRVVDGRVRLIDYGSDIHSDIHPPEGEKFDRKREFVKMCQRAYLSYRWANRGSTNFKKIARRALDNPEIPELDGFDWFYEAVRRVTGQHKAQEDVVLEMVGQAGRVLDYGCGNGWLSKEFADRGMQILGYDPDYTRRPHWNLLCQGKDNLRFTHERSDLLKAELFDIAVCRRVLCTIENDTELQTILGDLRTLVTERGRVIVTMCDPHFKFGGSTPEADHDLPDGAQYESTFVYEKKLRATGRVRRHAHRPERTLRREFARAGLAICRRVEVPTVDLERFEPASEQLAYELRPMAPLSGEVTLMIKACAMEADTLDIQVRHIISQLEEPRAFSERLLVLDSRENGFLRQYANGNLRDLRNAAHRLVEAGWIDRIVNGPDDGETTALLHQRWFGVPCPKAHVASGPQIASTLKGFEACKTRYVLQLDADVLIGRLDRTHDYLADILAVMADDPKALTVSFNIAMAHDRPYTNTASDQSAPWRTEVRAGLINLDRLRDARPLPNWLHEGRLARTWYRALDLAIRTGAGRSYRGGDRRTFYIHPPNTRKRNIEEWFAVLDRVEHGAVPDVQKGKCDLTGTYADWMKPNRREPFVFVVSGRNVPAGRLRRCIESMLRQKDERWGTVVFDDASDVIFAEHLDSAWEALRERCTIIRNRHRRGLLANMVTAIRTVCTNPDSVIVTLDADDALIGDRVLARLATEYARGADVTVGSMLRTDKAKDYPVCFDRSRERRGGGNVWQHLRSFKKYLFDAIPDDALRLDGEYIDIPNDWAYMLPIVEMAEKPVHISEPLYLYEPSGVGKGNDREVREAIIARIVAKPSLAGRRR